MLTEPTLGRSVTTSAHLATTWPDRPGENRPRVGGTTEVGRPAYPRPGRSDRDLGEPPSSGHVEPRESHLRVGGRRLGPPGHPMDRPANNILYSTETWRERFYWDTWSLLDATLGRLEPRSGPLAIHEADRPCTNSKPAQTSREAPPLDPYINPGERQSRVVSFRHPSAAHFHILRDRMRGEVLRVRVSSGLSEASLVARGWKLCRNLLDFDTSSSLELARVAKALPEFR
jgi:hypothetical protein